MLQEKVSQTDDNLVLIALGSNAGSRFGDPKATVLEAFNQIQTKGLKICAKSRLYQTPAFPPGSGPDYVNAAIVTESPEIPESLLILLHEIEAVFDRQRDKRWGARSLDLDLIAHGAQVLPDKVGFMAWVDLPPAAQQSQAPDRLILPHPRLQDRAFVLIPLLDVAPDWRHPVFGKTVKQMAETLTSEERAEITVI